MRSWPIGLVVLVLLISCNQGKEKENADESIPPEEIAVPERIDDFIPQQDKYIRIAEDVRIKDYFTFMDNLIHSIDTFREYTIDEYLLVYANRWLLDTLMNSDYYQQKARGNFIYNQPDYVVLRAGDSLLMPDSSMAVAWQNLQDGMVLDVNIPEFRLRLISGTDTLLSCPVRVGQNKKKFLKLVNRNVDLRTPVGNGEIIRIVRIPYHVDPETGKRYDSTKRDDNRYTKMPIIPWLEPSINNIRYGTLIHPTTNPRTLGRAYSNGCIGTTEADGWFIYYYVPVGTPVRFRYDLIVCGERGDSVRLRDIYKLYNP
ncbi:MAG: L,D-transpeptidase [Cyclobacteriaceae bacterium]|nr:L,D-transpeptidase [Cyclobacteriaceae bacterium]